VRGRRVFVTGLGFVSPLGDDPKEVFERICRGESAIRMVRSGTPEIGVDVLLASIDFDPGDRIKKADRLLMARSAQMAVVATGSALEDSGLLTDGQGPEEATVHMGCGLGGSEVIQESYRSYITRRRVRPTTVPLIMASAPASQVCMSFGIVGWPTRTRSRAPLLRWRSVKPFDRSVMVTPMWSSREERRRCSMMGRSRHGKPWV